MIQEIVNGGEMKNQMIAMTLAGNIRINKNGNVRVRGLGGMFNRNANNSKIKVNDRRL